ncbi:MAG: SCO family protein [Luteolibacter sp.]
MKTHLLLLSACLSLFATAAEETPRCCDEEIPAEEAAGSIYQLDATWTSQHEKEVKLSVFKGHPVLITMGYASCKNACPRLAADLMAIETSLTDEEKARTTFLFVSIDPEHDTPEKLAAFLKQYNVDQTRWIGLRGTDDSVLELSVALGVRYRKIENDDFAHSNLITLLSPSGEIIQTKEGLGTDSAEITAALKKLLATP